MMTRGLQTRALNTGSGSTLFSDFLNQFDQMVVDWVANENAQGPAGLGKVGWFKPLFRRGSRNRKASSCDSDLRFSLQHTHPAAGGEAWCPTG